jgi:outer membrane protein
MKKGLLLLGILLGTSISSTANAYNLMQVYQQALTSDPTYQQAIAQRLADKEGVPISLSNLLPSISGTLAPGVTRTDASGSATTGVGNTQRGYQMNLTLTQTIFNFANFANLAAATDTSKQADATFNAASQDLMIRVSKAYFAVLQDEDNLASSESTKKAFAKQYDQVNQQYQVGLKTVTDVYTAKASYERSISDQITAQTALANDKENLRVITGVLYDDLDNLSEKFPLISPQPSSIESWVLTAQQQNWSIRAAQYAAQAARMNIKQQFAGHLPTLNVQGIYNIGYTNTIGDSNAITIPGSSKLTNKTVQLNLNVPIVQGGLVIAQTHLAQDQYQVASQQLEKQFRDTVNSTRQSYLGVIAGISKVKADREGIRSSISSLEGMEAAYEVGTETLVNVLDQQQKVFIAQLQYARDRYAYVNDLLALKQATGTLSPDDLQAINAWLESGNDVQTTRIETKRITRARYHRH